MCKTHFELYFVLQKERITSILGILEIRLKTLEIVMTLSYEWEIF